MSLVFAAVLMVAVVVLWLPLISELLCLVRVKRPTPEPEDPAGHLPRFLFLVPAHDERLLIPGCVRSLVQMSYQGSIRVVVIADNCSDDTALLARECGAQVMERTDRDNAGKPRAIAWALDQIDLKQWDACVIVDADSTVAPDFAIALSRLGRLNDIAFQSNIGVLNEYENWLTRLGGLLSRCRYAVTYPLKQAAGLNCPVMGNGMGFGTSLLMNGGWRAFSITEDSELYAIYTEAGVSIRHASDANLFAQEPRSLGQGATQRRRWLAGRVRVIREWALPLLRSPRISAHQKLDVFVELGLASPVLHLLAALGVAAFAWLVVPGVLSLWIVFFALFSLSGIAITTIVAVLRHPQPWRTASSFLMLPAYAAWRLAVAAGTVVTLRDRTWRKTARTAPVG